ncbi:unnamed protein product [Staurois parvus]|uniref:Uncharacterized protein n=1 Tax=Staurois parvus TaxID=386267 RepID=A0ABN9CWV5_9NEOB|nr:unnamed protein product [Staurois parvus]
METLQKSM